MRRPQFGRTTAPVVALNSIGSSDRSEDHMSINRTTLTKGILAAGALTALLALGACADDPYYRSRSSVSLGVTSYDRYDNHSYRDRDGDGVPNWADDHPRNPYRW
jgi:hypothetical protein